MSADALAAALAAFEKPLRFAARNDFANLARIRGLDETLRSALERARAQVGDEPLITALAAALPKGEDSPENR
ncbi:MAG: hypothetical protein AAFQ82_27390, partial [Myxococcota bacterium]